MLRSQKLNGSTIPCIRLLIEVCFGVRDKTGLLSSSVSVYHGLPDVLSVRVISLSEFRLVAGPLYGPRVYLNFPYDPYVSGLDRYWAEAEFDLIRLDTRAFIGSGRNTQLTNPYQ